MNEQEQKLRDEILKDAKRKAERALTRAKRDADKACKQAETAQASEREQALARAGERAATQSRAVLATVAQEIRRRRLLAREEIIERCLDEALTVAESLPAEEYRRSLGELLAEALAALGPGEATIRVRPADLDLLSPPCLTTLGIESAGLTVVADAAIVRGVVAESHDGRRQFDNTYATRRKRLRERLRTLLAGEIDF